MSPDNYTFADIFWIVRHCQEHEQMMMACAAQSVEMWPKTKEKKLSQKQVIDAQLSVLFDRNRQ